MWITFTLGIPFPDPLLLTLLSVEQAFILQAPDWKLGVGPVSLLPFSPPALLVLSYEPHTHKGV